MFKCSFGWTGIKVPVIGQGTWMIECGQDEESNPIEALRLGLKLGMTHIDTAEMAFVTNKRAFSYPLFMISLTS